MSLTSHSPIVHPYATAGSTLSGTPQGQTDALTQAQLLQGRENRRGYPPRQSLVGVGWPIPGALYDLDFTGDRYYSVNHGMTNLSNLMTWSRSGSVLTMGENGLLQTCPANTLAYDWWDGTSRFTPGATPMRGLAINIANVTNYCLWNRDLTDAVWTKTNATAQLNQIGSDGASNSASLLTADADNATCNQVIPTTTPSYGTVSLLIKRVSGSGTISIGFAGSYNTVVPLSDAWTAYVHPTIGTNGGTLSIKLGTAGDAVAVDYVHWATGAIGRFSSRIATTNAAATITTDTIRLLPVQAGLGPLPGFTFLQVFFGVAISNDGGHVVTVFGIPSNNSLVSLVHSSVDITLEWLGAYVSSNLGLLGSDNITAEPKARAAGLSASGIAYICSNKYRGSTKVTSAATPAIMSAFASNNIYLKHNWVRTSRIVILPYFLPPGKAQQACASMANQYVRLQ